MALPEETIVHGEKSLREWMLGHLERTEIEDIVEHGIDAGYTGFIYYHEIIQLYDAFEDEIWEMLDEDSDSFGFKTIPGFIDSWKTANTIADDSTFKTALVWYAGERIASELVAEWEDEDED